MKRAMLILAVVAGTIVGTAPVAGASFPWSDHVRPAVVAVPAAVDATCMSYVTKPVIQSGALVTGNARSSCSSTNTQDSYVGILRNGTLIGGYNHVGCFCTAIGWHNKQILDVAGSQCYQTEHFLIFNGGSNSSTVDSQCVFG